MRSLYEISGIIDDMLKGGSGLEDDILAVITDINERLDLCDRKISNLERYARKLKKNLNDIVSEAPSA